MQRKQKFLEILAKLKSWSDLSGDEELDEHLTELENHINASFTAADEEEGDGGNHPPVPPGKP